MTPPGGNRHRRRARHRPRLCRSAGGSRLRPCSSPIWRTGAGSLREALATRGAGFAYLQVRSLRRRLPRSPCLHGPRRLRPHRLPGQQCRHRRRGARRPARPGARRISTACSRVNLRGTVFLTQAVARAMLATPTDQSPRRSSPSPRSAPRWPRPSAPTTASPRPGFRCGRRTWRCGWPPENIGVFEVRPGIIRTDMTAGVSAEIRRADRRRPGAGRGAGAKPPTSPPWSPRWPAANSAFRRDRSSMSMARCPCRGCKRVLK